MTYCEIPGCGRDATYEIGWSLRCSRHKKTTLPTAPQAQEEPSGAPAPAVTVPRWAADMGIAAINALENPTATQAAARRVMGEALAQPPAPASQAGLVWTKEKPKVEGWYWVQRLALKPYCVQVIDWMGRLQVDDSWNDKTIEVERFTDDYEWAGPIPEPSPADPEAGATRPQPCPGVVSKDCANWTCTYSKEGICLTCGGKRPAPAPQGPTPEKGAP